MAFYAILRIIMTQSVQIYHWIFY